MSGTYWCMQKKKDDDDAWETITAFAKEEEAKKWVAEDPKNRQYSYGMG